MNNRDRKNNNSGIVGIAIVAILALTRLVFDALSGSNLLVLILPLLFIVIVAVVIGFATGKYRLKAKKGTVYQRERTREKAMNYFTRDDNLKQAVKCTHPRGKEKYFAQLDNFLANGLIDKSEYRVLKERYEKIVIPDNMH